MILYVEDLIHRLACNGNYIFSSLITMSTNDRMFFTSLSEQICRTNQGLTRKQQSLSLKLIKKYSSPLSLEFSTDIDSYLLNPQYRLEERVISNDKEIKIVKESNGEYFIHVLFPYDSELISRFRDYKNNSKSFEYRTAYWDQELRLWKFSLTEHNILFLSNLQGFKKDSKFIEFYKEITTFQESMEYYIPMVVKDESGKFIFKNVHQNIPICSFDDMLESLLIAKKYGITCWSEEINKELEDINNDLLKSFLKSDYRTQVASRTRKIELKELEKIICTYDKILFVIPGGQEFKYLNQSYEFIKEIGYNFEKCSVMFRLEKSSDLQNCNEFIHRNSLNNPLDQQIKFVFISVKVPKPLLESELEFDLVINFGANSSAHFSLQQFLKTHHNVVTINPLIYGDKNYVYV